ncbi:late competence development ComFB family protein [Agathobaculum sp. NTUH-O15-33]|uniref:late competence development ComFB family protein n=1 Tax=Agathobaculum sp. NTUH-O15-33 TaxID=3079302 RepID=UPI002958B045|nr:late competence development ComFB family protein [Agathobaculum sp. NTUH-O15-33]WNX84786.1 late competence development ComFB family protein [Agathobaculum sp. NTUH-O15-33]
MAKSKKVLDRDMMFRKIMPALADNPFSAPVTEASLLGEEPDAPAPQPEPEAAPAPEPAAVPEAAPEPVVPAPAKPKPAAKPRCKTLAEAPFTQTAPAPEESDELSVLRARLFARSDNAEAGLEQVSTVNLMESLVLRHLDTVIQRFNCCRCDRCRRDVAACSLNHLPPKYVVADPDRLDSMAETIPAKTVYDALIKAVLKVRANPHH